MKRIVACAVGCVFFLPRFAKWLHDLDADFEAVMEEYRNELARHGGER